jgi:hypothetical protein
LEFVRVRDLDAPEMSDVTVFEIKLGHVRLPTGVTRAAAQPQHSTSLQGETWLELESVPSSVDLAATTSRCRCV